MPLSYSTTEQDIGYAGKNVSNEAEIILIGVPCDVCENHNAFKDEKNKLLTAAVHYPPFFIPKSLK
jgi:hypothetical protein